MGANISDEDLAEIATISNLENLYLDSTQVTNQGIKYLYRLKSLKMLGVYHTAVDLDKLIPRLREAAIKAEAGRIQ